MYEDIIGLREELLSLSTKEEMIERLIEKYESYKNNYLVPGISNFLDDIIDETLEYAEEREEVWEELCERRAWAKGALELFAEAKEEIIALQESEEKLLHDATLMARMLRLIENKGFVSSNYLEAIEAEAEASMIEE